MLEQLQKQLGETGQVGVVVLLSGIGVLAFINRRIAAGVSLVVVGLSLALYGMFANFMDAMGMGNMVPDLWPASDEAE